MQSIRQPVVSTENVVAEDKSATPSKKTPLIVLDGGTLEHVAGGLSPKGTWGADTTSLDTTDSPKGTW